MITSATIGHQHKTFFDWVKESAQLVQNVTILCGAGQAIIAGVIYVKHQGKDLGQWWWAIFFALQVSLLCIIYGWVKSHPPDPTKCSFPPPPRNEPSEKDTVERLFKYWTWLLISWLAFYSLMTIWWILRAGGAKVEWLGPVLDLFTRPYVILYYFLYRIIRDHAAGYQRRSLPWDGAAAAIIVTTLADVSVYLLHDPKDLIPLGPIFVQSICSVAECVAITLLVSKLDSYLIPANRFIVPSLYVFAGIQNLFGAAALFPPAYFAVLLVFTLLGKSLLACYLTWLFREGLLCSYLYNARIIALEARQRVLR